MTDSPCPGCGLALPAAGGPTHAYVVTSPECWALFAATSHQIRYRLFTDAYMAQHPDGDDRRQVQSVAVHLITLRAILVEGQPLTAASTVTAAAVELGRAGLAFPKLERPTWWESTIASVADEAIPPDRYASEVLSAWDQTEGARIAEWTRATLDRLFRD